MRYRDELLYSTTKFPDGKISEKMADDPRYTEEMQIFNRWCERYMEYYLNYEYNKIIIEANEREWNRRQSIRDELKKMMDETYNRRIPKSAMSMYEAVSKPVEKYVSINEGYDPSVLDEEVKAHGLYTSEFEIIKQWLHLMVIQMKHNEFESLRNQFTDDDLASQVESDVSSQKLTEDFNNGIEPPEND